MRECLLVGEKEGGVVFGDSRWVREGKVESVSIQNIRGVWGKWGP